MINYHIKYEVATKNGRRTYRRVFEDNDTAVDYARRKASEPQVENVRGYEYDDREDVVYVFTMAL